MTTAVARKDQQITESLDVITKRIQRNLALMVTIAERATYDQRIAIGKDLRKAKLQMSHGEFLGWMERNFTQNIRTLQNYMAEAEAAQKRRASHIKSQSDVLRERNPHYGMPRQKADEKPIRNILDGVNVRIFAERADNEVKETRLKRAMALELVEAGFRVLSHKHHPDHSGGKDDAMRRLDEVRKALKSAITNNEIAF